MTLRRNHTTRKNAERGAAVRASQYDEMAHFSAMNQAWAGTPLEEALRLEKREIRLARIAKAKARQAGTQEAS